MARAAKEEPDEGRRRKKKTGIGTIFNRLLIVSLIGGCAYFYGQTVHLEDQLTQARASQSTNVRPGVLRPITRRTQPLPPRRADYLSLAQTHTQKAEQALAAGNVGNAWRESQAATQAAHAASVETGTQTQRALTQVKSRLAAVQERAAKLWRNVGG